jgi:hypothetical protein
MAGATSPTRRQRSEQVAQLVFTSDGAPLAKPEDVIGSLGKQEQYWKEKYCVYETAHSWFEAQDLPRAIRATLETDPVYADAKLMRAFFEKQPALKGHGTGPNQSPSQSPSQTDVLAILKIKSGLAVVGVEGRVNEPFGDYVFQWNDGSASKASRLAAMIKRLRLEPAVASNLRYQLLHRTMAALSEAEMIGAREAAMLIQSFSPDNVRAGFSDFQVFGAALDMPIAQAGRLSQPIDLGDVRLRIGWTVDRMRGAAAG